MKKSQQFCFSNSSFFKHSYQKPVIDVKAEINSTQVDQFNVDVSHSQIPAPYTTAASTGIDSILDLIRDIPNSGDNETQQFPFLVWQNTDFFPNTQTYEEEDLIRNIESEMQIKQTQEKGDNHKLTISNSANILRTEEEQDKGNSSVYLKETNFLNDSERYVSERRGKLSLDGISEPQGNLINQNILAVAKTTEENPGTQQNKSNGDLVSHQLEEEYEIHQNSNSSESEDNKSLSQTVFDVEDADLLRIEQTQDKSGENSNNLICSHIKIKTERVKCKVIECFGDNQTCYDK